ncbi:WD repeat and HMG-box DNA-binding protein 1 [Eufriesea mexicana]|uniref:WD repeat and HMG-box DNA-binding protein 1 n=1 Tax=Eufriesea mexicana TaxID=516756 RepID=A0A310SN29_9HYME|nr:WD repeat and HMG-box DNA-binding protein 1 [Eufriesea mexicana]
MPLVKKPMRYAHPEGHTDVCYFSGEKRGLITCGSDGDVRSWLNLMDDDPSTSCVSEQAISIISKNEKIFVGNDNNTIQILNYPDLEKEGIVTRFSAPVSALATTKNSSLIVSGGCDMRIQITDINTSDNIELIGHEAPILGLSLDPKEKFVASSSADGSIRVWDIKTKCVANIWVNVIPKCNSFFTAKIYGVPSFHPKDGSYLAFPSIKDEISICKFSECGTLLAASSAFGEMIVWNVESKELIGYIEHQQNAKITALSWNIDKSDEFAFCDFLGQLGCIDVIVSDKTTTDELDLETNGDVKDSNIDIPEVDEDDDDEDNVISLNKIKASTELEDDKKSHSDSVSEKSYDANAFTPEIHLQLPFQPGSSPKHLLSRFMVWNDIGMVRCFTSEDGDESSIEVEFHDVTIHRSIHINNYLRHTIAALSQQALALNCPSNSDTRSKLVVIALQGWGSGNKEWSLDLPEGEEGHCVAAGDNFVALSTSRRHLRIFTVGGTQREIVALPGPVVTMNGLRNNLVLAYHNGIGKVGDQKMNLLLIQIRRLNLFSQTLCLPLSPLSELMWLGITDLGSPVIMDTDDVIKVYCEKSSLWKVASDMNTQSKGKADHYFIIGISEQQSIARCVLCKGSHYPPTTPRPVIIEISLTLPLCELETDKTEKEQKLWKLGTNSSEKNEISIVDIREEEKENEMEYKSNDANFNEDDDKSLDNDAKESILSLSITKRSDIEIKPLPMTETLSLKRNNPFLKSGTGLDITPEKPQKLATPVPSKSKTKEVKDTPKKETFISWYAKNKKSLQEKFPDLSPADLTKIALTRYKEQTVGSQNNSSVESTELKKRKLSPESEQENQPKRAAKHAPLDVIQNAMGVMGPWHIVIAIALSLVKFPVAWHQLSIIFLAPPTNFSCAAPISMTNESTIMKCYVNVGNGTMEKCTNFKYDRRIFKESIITQWNLVCDREQLANFIQSCIMLGVLIGNLIFSIMADRIGRKKPLMIAIGLQSLTGFISAFVPWFELFVIFKFISAIATGGTMLVSFVLLMEIVGIEWRSTMSVLFHVPFLLGHLMNPLISYLTHTWDGFQMAVSIPSLFLLSYYWIIPESPRWLLAIGKLSKAEQILIKAANRNKIPIENVKTAIETYESNMRNYRKRIEDKYNITHLFRTPNLRLKTICICINWFVCGSYFFGLAQYMGYIDGNIFVNVAVSAAVELPGTIVVLLLISRVSRLRILISGNILSAVSLLLLTVISDSNFTVFLATLGLAGMSLSFPTIYLYSSEAFPTVVRNVGVGLGSVCARIGSMIAPYIATMGKIKPWLPPLVFGAGPLLGALLCFFLPETMNCELPETIEDGENFGK